MRPVEIHVKNFLSYVEERLTFPEHSSVICVTGQNGDGKSSLVVDTVLCALFAEGRGERLDDMIRDGENEALVAFTFEANGSRYRVTRKIHRTVSRNARLLEEWSGSAWVNPVNTDAEVKAGLFKLLPYSYTTFIHTAFVLQGQTDRFLRTKKADERQETLAEVLALVGYEERAEVAKELRLAAGKEAEFYRKQSDQLRETAASRRVDAQAKQRTYVALEASLSSRESPLREALEHATLRLGTLQQARDTYRSAFSQLRVASRQYRQNNRRLASTQHELEVLGQQAEARDQMAAAVSLFEESDISIRRWEEIRTVITGLNREIELVKAQAKVHDQQLAQQVQHATKLVDELQQKQHNGQAAAKRARALEPLLDLWDQHDRLEQSRQVQHPELDRVRKSIDHIETEEGPCPFCLQELKGASREQALVRLREQRRSLELADDGLAGEIRTLSLCLQEGAEELQVPDRPRAQIALHQARTEVAEGENATTQLLDAHVKVKGLDQQIAAGQAQLQADLKPLSEQLAGLTYDPENHDYHRRRMETHRATYEEYRRLATSLADLPVLKERVKGLGELVDSDQQRRLAGTRLALGERRTARGFREALAAKQRADEEYKAILGERQQAGNELAAARSTLAECKKDEEKADKLAQEANNYTVRVRLLDVLQKAYSPDGIPALIIRQAMPSLLSKANTLLERWTGGRIQIDQKAASVPTGRRSRSNLSDLQFEIWDLDSACVRPYALYSGGERFRVDMALRIALSQLLAERAGSPVQMLVIDEGFGTQDPDGLQKMVQIINDLRKDFHSIIVISHIEEIKRMGYDRWIRIVKEEGVSRIER